ncbi:DUF4395 domain-containing protein [Paenibacillus thermoaerophilus]|uniref:DUF4395 domain-containing protein n=1 Tax=Paenibacillus thermoaerophilus TaxID=1215385 RepID=A0ABW2UXN7_9BACL|nr:DUF4395 domain-containing protein [Paenibacillus thermoaerophilus]TMV19068.1 DUF4395 domain-containing protein [Paenibacillus thermoaerophilus]
MQEIPIRLVKSNQTGIVISLLLFLLTSQLWIVAILWAIQLIGLVSSGRLNVFARIGALLPAGGSGETQAAELTRFNNVLAVVFLSLSLIFFAAGWNIPGYVFAVGLLGAAGAALAGYCIGCTIYYQYKRLRRRL